MKIPPKAEETLDRFSAALERHSRSVGWTASAASDGSSNREYLVTRGPRTLRVMVKLSQSATGFWGLTDAKARDIVEGTTDVLILLTGAFEGYVIPHRRLARLLPTFARTTNRPEYRINEGKVRGESRFTTMVRLWEYLVMFNEPG